MHMRMVSLETFGLWIVLDLTYQKDQAKPLY
jgi:hypothetical protein